MSKSTKTFDDNTGLYKSLLDSFLGGLSDVDISKIKDSENRETTTTIIEKQAEYVWLRVNLYEEIPDIVAGDIIKMTFVPSGESIEFTMGTYDKKGLYKDEDGVTKHSTDDDMLTMCLLVDMENINKNSEQIPYIRTFFRSSRYYTPELLRKEDILLECEEKKITIDYKRINF